MTAQHKKFILNKLIPFILREQGRGFVMATWTSSFDGATYHRPGIWGRIKSTACGTAYCIGGSIDHLNGVHVYTGQSFESAGKAIGLNSAQSHKLFAADIRWPQPFRSRYTCSTTALGKARAAAALLRKVVRTNGKCLDRA